jgi:N-acetylneuraminate synthase
MERVFICAEIGINHNGDLSLAKKLIDAASVAGCDAVKFQKRNIDLVYTREFLDSPRESPWGSTQRAQKEGIELSEDEYDAIDKYCREKGIEWFASSWDVESQKFLRKYGLGHNKIASAMLTRRDILEAVASEKRHTFISTGMSDYGEIDAAVEIFAKYGCPYELMHTNSTYPMKDEDANLLVMTKLRERYGCEVGYSGHEIGTLVTIAAIALGATSIERHVTIDRNMYGSDQKASIEPYELCALVRDIRIVERALGSGEKILSGAELAIRRKLRGN